MCISFFKHFAVLLFVFAPQRQGLKDVQITEFCFHHNTQFVHNLFQLSQGGKWVVKHRRMKKHFLYEYVWQKILSVSPEPYCSVFSWFWGLTSSEKCRLWWQTAYLWEEILYLRIVAFKVQRQKQPCAQLSHTELLMQVYYSDWRCYTFLKTQRNGNWLGLESICSKNTLYQNRKPLNFLTSFFPFSFFSQRQTH